MGKRLDPDIRGLAEKMQERRNEAASRVKAGEIIHLNFMDREAALGHAERNLNQLDENRGDEALISLADAGVYGLAVIAKGDEAEAEE